MAEEAKTYHVLNTVRCQGTRLHRARPAQQRHRFKLFIAGQRLLRNKKLPLTEAQFEKEKDRIHGLVLEGKVALFLPDGIRVTSLPDGRLVYTKPNGATKIGEFPKEAEAPKEAAAPPPTPPPVPPKDEMKKDVLTNLPSVGPGRARKLEAAGVISYKQVASLEAAALSEILGVTAEVAEDIRGAAQKMKG